MLTRCGLVLCSVELNKHRSPLQMVAGSVFFGRLNISQKLSMSVSVLRFVLSCDA